MLARWRRLSRVEQVALICAVFAAIAVIGWISLDSWHARARRAETDRRGGGALDEGDAEAWGILKRIAESPTGPLGIQEWEEDVYWGRVWSAVGRLNRNEPYIAAVLALERRERISVDLARRAFDDFDEAWSELCGVYAPASIELRRFHANARDAMVDARDALHDLVEAAKGGEAPSSELAIRWVSAKSRYDAEWVRPEIAKSIDRFVLRVESGRYIKPPEHNRE